METGFDFKKEVTKVVATFIGIIGAFVVLFLTF